MELTLKRTNEIIEELEKVLCDCVTVVKSLDDLKISDSLRREVVFTVDGYKDSISKELSNFCRIRRKILKSNEEG